MLKLTNGCKIVNKSIYKLNLKGSIKNLNLKESSSLPRIPTNTTITEFQNAMSNNFLFSTQNLVQETNSFGSPSSSSSSSSCSDEDESDSVKSVYALEQQI